MTCENQPIAEMLVPYVEGALAEAERAEVTDHLRHCPACREEARVLRDTIVGLRGVFSGGYRPTLASHPPAEEVSAFVLEPQTLPEDRRNALHVHMLECDACAAEAQLLRDMHKDLEGRVAPGGAPLVLPRALREEIEAVYPAGRPLPPRVEGAAALPFMERLAHMLSRFNWRPVLATGLAAVVLSFGFLFAYSGRNAEMAVETRSTTTTTAAAPSPVAAAPVAPSEVPLMVPAGKAEESAQALEKEKIPFQNRDGKLYLSPGDVERARRVLDTPEPEPQIAMADRAASLAQEGPAAVSDDRTKDERPAEDKVVATSEPAPAPAPAPPPPVPAPPVERARPAPVERPRATTAPARPQQPRQEVASAGGASGRTQAAPAPTPPRTAGTVAPVTAAEPTAPAPRPVPMAAANAPTGAGAPAPSSGAVDEADAEAPPTPMVSEAADVTEGYTAKSTAGPRTNAAPEPQVQTQAPAAAAPPVLSRADTLEPRARQVATEGNVTIEETEDGSVRIVVRARRALTAQEEEDLRRRLRRELGLRDSDTITIRQP